MEGNKYWEEQRRQYFSTVEEDELIRKSSECQLVLDKLDKDELWQIIQRDAKDWAERLDRNWQDTYDENQLKQMRVLKLSANHLINLRKAYIAEWKLSQEELTKRKDPNVMDKDYDGN